MSAMSVVMVTVALLDINFSGRLKKLRTPADVGPFGNSCRFLGDCDPVPDHSNGRKGRVGNRTLIGMMYFCRLNFF